MDDGGIDAGRAVETDPAAGEEVASDSTITLFLSTGKVDLPDLSGQSESDAKSALTALGLIPAVTYEEFPQGPYGEVESQTPSASRVDNGTTVTLVVGKQPSTVGVPDVVGKSESSAKSDIQNAGLKVGSVTTDTSDPQVDKAGTVKSTNPKSGTQVTPDTSVDIVLYCDVQAVLATPDPDDPATTTTSYVCK